MHINKSQNFDILYYSLYIPSFPGLATLPVERKRERESKKLLRSVLGFLPASFFFFLSLFLLFSFRLRQPFLRLRKVWPDRGAFLHIQRNNKAPMWLHFFCTPFFLPFLLPSTCSSLTGVLRKKERREQDRWGSRKEGEEGGGCNSNEKWIWGFAGSSELG